MTVTLSVTKRIAEITATEQIVAGNTYPVALALDSEWTGNLYLRVRFGSQYYDIPFTSTDTSVDVQMPISYPAVGIGVYSEALEICTNEARLNLLRSILEAGESVVEFDSDLYQQWVGEVTELLTDSDFDAESTNPVQNATLTAWKATVPLDSDLVHKDGAETITGGKTFQAVQRFDKALNLRPFSRGGTQGKWQKLCSCARPSTTGAGVSGVFYYSTQNFGLGTYSGILHVAERTTGADSQTLYLIWLCGHNVHTEDYAVTIENGRIVLYASKHTANMVHALWPMLQWGSGTYGADLWQSETSEPELDSLPEGVPIVYSRSASGPLEPVSALNMMAPNPGLMAGVDLPAGGDLDGGRSESLDRSELDVETPEDEER